jgi:hypothetical protein
MVPTMCTASELAEIEADALDNIGAAERRHARRLGSLS